jgi:hypothetical protein
MTTQQLLNERLINFRRVTDEAPEGSFEHSKAVREIIGRAMDQMIREFRVNGINVCLCDGAFETEAKILDWVLKADGSTEVLSAAVMIEPERIWR